MLKNLRIANIVLVENAQLPFGAGFNVLTGETGSGKSAVMQALNFIAGARTESHIVRHDTDKGTIEAVFDIEEYTAIKEILEEAGIDHEHGEELMIRREIYRTGKSKAFVNNQHAHLSLLKKLGENLLEIVGQHANRRLMKLEEHREIVDLFAATVNLKKQFRVIWEELCLLNKHVAELKTNEAQRLRQIEICRMELNELDEAAVKDNEDEELFAEYTRLINSEEIARLAFEIHSTLIDNDQSAINILKHTQSTFAQLIKHDSTMNSTFAAYESALIEIEETARIVGNYHARIEHDPHKIAEINERLGIINKIKRKYGPTTADICRTHEETKQKLKHLESSDIQIESLQSNIEKAEAHLQILAEELTQKRTAASQKLEAEMKKQLEALNMPKAEFYVIISPQPRHANGDESIEFFFAPNVGEKKIAIRECASGGELSRIMLGLQTLLAGKEKIPTLVFDEIDANIGGETALVIGEKLREIGGCHQILCITHFPQVAKCAQHHIQISKQERNGRTYTETQLLEIGDRQKELIRMSGETKVANPR